MRIGSLFSGIGGLDLACEWALGGTTSWQLDLAGTDVRRRHFPDAIQIEADVATVDPLDLPRVDVLCGGPACQDLSCAGKGASREELEYGARTGPTYLNLLRFVRAIRPEIVVIENVPALLHHQWRVERDLVGYGLTWVRCGAWDAGAPHIRRRAFVVAVAGTIGRGVVDAPTVGRWKGDNVREWATPSANESGTGRRGPGAGRGSCPGDESLTGQCRVWDTPRANPGGSGRRGGDRHNEEMLDSQVRTWTTPRASDERSPGEYLGRNGSPGLSEMVRTWPTPNARDYKCGDLPNRVGTEALSEAASLGKRLSADWTETLQGYPIGWTLPEGPRLEVEPAPRWPRGRYPATWDRSVPWPGYDWEPPRTLPDGPPVPGRPARVRALGNAVCPQQGALAIRTARP